MDRQQLKPAKSTTLIELLIGIVIFSIIVLGFAGIDYFARARVLSATRRSVVQNEASLVLDRIQKQLVRAIGNIVINGPANIVNTAAIAGNQAIRIFVDDNGGAPNGVRDAGDIWLAFQRKAANPGIYFMQFCAQCNAAGACAPGWQNIGGPRIQNFIRGIVANSNRVTLTITVCWNPATGVPPNGTVTNPCVTMSTAVAMPMVSTN